MDTLIHGGARPGLGDPMPAAALNGAPFVVIPTAVPDELPAVMPDQDLGLPSLAGLRRRTFGWLARRAVQTSN